MNDQLSKLIAERNAALKTLDMNYARRMLPTASSDEVRLLAMHKARYECTDIAAEFRHASGHWLRERGCARMDGSELLPEGELPLPANVQNHRPARLFAQVRCIAGLGRCGSRLALTP